jgi:DNA-binding winged helix-turn-helix (wHTH) protein/TolB-like protein
MALQTKHLYEFGPFRVHPTERLLLREQRPVQLTAKAFDILLLLVQEHGHLVEKSELMTVVWKDNFVEEGNLAVAISTIRKALNDVGNDHQYIQTVTGHGYRFVADVRDIVEPEPESHPPVLDGSPLLPEGPPLRRPFFYPLTVGLLLLAVLIAGATLLFFRKSSRTQTEIHSLAVLPFRSKNADAAHEYLRLGFADAIITKLASTGQINVRPTSAVVKYVDSAEDPRVAGRELRVDAVLEGNIETLSDRVRVTVQLVRDGDGLLIWADTFEKDSQEIFALEDAVAERVAESMVTPLSEAARKRLTRRETENPQAYQFYMMGRHFWNQKSKEGLRRSIEYFQKATREDPRYALAYAGLADSYVSQGLYGIEAPRQANTDAKGAVLQALNLDDTLAEAHASLGVIAFYYDWDWPKAEQEFRRAIALNPNYAMAYDWYALYFVAMGRGQEALDQIRRAKELDPVSLTINTTVGHVYLMNRQFDEAISAYRQTLDLDPQFERARTRLGMTYVARGAYGDAIREFEIAKNLTGADPYLDGVLGYTLAMSGNAAKAHVLCDDLILRSRSQYVSPFSIALVHIGLGEQDRAFEWLDKAYQDRAGYMVFAKTDPLLEPLRPDPRFAVLLHRMGLM